MIKKGDEFEVSGQTFYHAEQFAVVRARNSSLQLLIDANGAIFNSAIIGGGMIAVGAEPPGRVFAGRTRIGEETVSKAGFTNYEILYTGRSDSSLNLAYREYTPDDMARPAFTQNLTYEAGAKTIRFRDLQIEVLGANSERIEFRVIAE